MMLKIEVGSVNRAETFVKNNINLIGKPKSVTHISNSEMVEYETIIEGTEDIMIVLGGLTSGYDGAGPNGLKRTLVFLGIDEETAHNYSRQKSGVKHNF